MNKRMTILLLLTLPACAQAGELGRLFNTPQQRQQLEYQDATSTSAADTGRARNYIIVNGVVQKQGGKRTTWINGAPQVSERGNDKTPASVPVTVPGRNDPVHLKVGQRLMLEQPKQEEAK